MLKGTICTGLAFLSVAFVAPARGEPIFGEVDMAGRIGTNTGNLATATALSFSNAWTSGGTGSYASIDGEYHEVYHASFAFSPSLSGPINPLWRFSDDGVAYSFVMDNVEVQSQSASSLTLFGWGTLYITGYDPTPGVWNFSAFGSEGRFKFASNSASVPEPATLVLFGLGLLGLGVSGRSRRS